MKELTSKVLRDVLDYDSETGIFRWKERPREYFDTDATCKAWNKRFAMEAAGSISTTQGYVFIILFRKRRPAHRLAWLYMHGEWPDQIDHINHVRDDNRIGNLRNVDGRENCKNLTLPKDNKSGVCGVSFNSERNKWVAQLKINGKQTNLGLYENFEDAVTARKTAEIENGYHENHGNKAVICTKMEAEFKKRKQEKQNAPMRGIYWHSRDKIWTLRLRIEGKDAHCGNFKNAEQAVAARSKIERENGASVGA